jgi:hypothetical protein
MAMSRGAMARLRAGLFNTWELAMIDDCIDLLERRSSNAMAPLASHVDAGLPLSISSLYWLVSLLRPGKHYLTVKNRAGRPSKGKSGRNNLIVKRFAELHKATITDALFQSLQATAGMSIVEPDAAAPETHQFGWHEQDDYGDWIPVRLTLKLGNALNLLQAQTIITAEFRVSVSTVKRVLAAHKRALYKGPRCFH